QRAVLSLVALRSVHEHVVMLTLDLIERVAERTQEIVVGAEHDAVGVEVEDALGLVDGGELTGTIRERHHSVGDVDDTRDDLEPLSVQVANRIERGLHPDRPAILRDSPVNGGLHLALAQLLPERTISGGITLLRRNEHAVMLASDIRHPEAGRPLP